MGLVGVAVDNNRARWNSAWSNRNPCKSAAPGREPVWAYWDYMENLVGLNRKVVTNRGELAREFIYWTEKWMKDCPTCSTFIMGFDQKRLDGGFIPKQVHTNSKRREDGRRWEERQAAKVAAMSKEDREEYERTLVTEFSAYGEDSDPLPTHWNQFIAKRENRWTIMQMFTALLMNPAYIMMPVGKMIVTMGLPFVDGHPIDFDDTRCYQVFPVREKITEEMVREDPELFGRCMWIRGHQEPYKQAITMYIHYEQWDCQLWEADFHPVHFYRFMKGKNCLVRSNDRDMLLTLLAHGMDRRLPGSADFADHMYLWMPNKAKTKRADGWVGDFFVDMNELWTSIHNDERLAQGAYNRVLTYVFVMLLTGCDHVRKDMFYNLNSVDHVLECFYSHSIAYRHMVQLSNLLIPDPSAIRIPLIDERNAMDFMSRVYLMRYGEQIEKKKQAAHAKEVRRLEREYKKACTKWTKAVAQLEKKRAAYLKKHPAMAPTWDDDDEVDWPDNLAEMPEEPPAPVFPVLDTSVSRDDIRELTSKYKKAEESTLPPREMLRRDIRYATLALIYIIDVGRDQSLFRPGGLFDPLAKSKDNPMVSYWGYEENPLVPGTYQMAEYVWEVQDLDTWKYPKSYLDKLTPKRREKLARDQKAADELASATPPSPVDYQKKKELGASFLARMEMLQRK